MKYHIAYVIGGGNMGDTTVGLREVLAMLGLRAGKVLRTSGLYQTEPWGFTAEQPFLNQVIELQTQLSPHNLLSVLQELERILGRVRNPGTEYISRTIDLDILLYDQQIVESPSLSIPHPLMQERMFVLTPLCDLIPGYIHPILKESVEELRKKCTDRHRVEQYCP